MVDKIREVESAVGNGSKNGPRPEEQDMYKKIRRSLHANCDINEGEIITKKMLVSKRPGFGVPIHLEEFVVGRKATMAIKKDQWIEWSHI